MADTPRPSLIGWILGVSLTGVPTLVLLILGLSFSGSGSATLTRLEVALRGDSKEKVVAGVVSPRAGVEVLTAPASDAPCLAWDTTVSVAWPETDSSGNEETKSRALKGGSRAVPFEVKKKDEVVAFVDEPSLDLRGPPQYRDYGEPPAWTDSLSGGERGADSTDARRSYRSVELTLPPGAYVTMLGIRDPNDAKRLLPTPGDERLFVHLGTPESLREGASQLVVVGTWLTRASLVTGALFLLLAAGLVRAVMRRRRA